MLSANRIITDCCQPNSSCGHAHLWGKKTDDGAYYPLLAHLVDTAAAMDALISEWLPAALVKRLRCLVGVDTVDDLAKILCSLAAYHDIGKINPTFQGQEWSPAKEQFAVKRKDLEGHGFKFQSNVDVNAQPDPGKDYIKRHEVASGLVVEASATYDKVSRHTGLVVAGHHGRWAAPSGDSDTGSTNACAYYKEIYKKSSKWYEAIKSMEAELCALDRVHSLDCLSLVVLADPACIPLLTALVCLADWVASDSDSVDCGTNYIASHPGNISDFYEARLKYYKITVPTMLGTPKHPSRNFKEIFGFDKNPLQEYMCADKTSGKHHGLTVVMTPTGSGKTEAVLGYWLGLPNESKQGLYFGLPTMATSDTMFDRVRNIFKEGESYGALLHGRSMLNSFYDAPTRDVSVLSYDASASDGLVAGDWFNGKHRALFSPIGVGTVDQVLQTVLAHKYNYMRLLALATKTVVLDEVHSFDPYMHELLKKLLEWAGVLHLDIVLLSATLPETRLHEYVCAYRSGLGCANIESISSITYPSVLQISAMTGDITVENLTLPAAHRSVLVKYTQVPQGITGTEDSIAKELATVLKESPQAKIGVIVNTVKCAQAVARIVARTSGVKYTVFHSRTTANLRAATTTNVIKVFGKHSVDTHGHVLIATQVAEQSLDVDFDYIISEMCPVASLVQRMGRLHRFADRVRPDALKAPTMQIVHKAREDINYHSVLPYPSTEILKTLTMLLNEPQVGNIQVPDDIQNLVNRGAVTFTDIETDIKAQITHGTQKAAALENSIPSPKEAKGRIPRRTETALRSFLKNYSGSKTRSFTETRWSLQESLTILLYTVSSNSTLQVYKGEPPLKPNRKETLALLGHTVALSGSLASKLLKKEKEEDSPVTAVWDTGILKGVLCVNADSCSDWLELDDILGLYEK